MALFPGFPDSPAGFFKKFGSMNSSWQWQPITYQGDPMGDVLHDPSPPITIDISDLIPPVTPLIIRTMIGVGL